MNRNSFLNAMVVLSLIASMFALAVMPPGGAVALSGGRSSRDAVRPPTTRQPQLLPAVMPVFQIMHTLVNPDTILGNAGLLNGVGATQVVSDTSRGGLKHLFAFNPDTKTVVDQFNRTGGLFAVNYQRAYTETEMLVNPTNTDICLFLSRRQLIPNDVDPQYTDCQNNPAYLVKQIHLATETPATGGGTNMVIGELVQVPLAINIGAAAPDFIPLGGPGGHLSLMFAGDPHTPSLDDTMPGLQSLANPYFGRFRSVDPIGYFPVVPMAKAIERFKARFPTEMQVDAGTPLMVYYLGFPDVPQDAVMPTWTFPDATAIISGTVVSLKDTSMPGVEGYAPAVTILSPADGTIFMPGQDVSINFSVTGSAGPFTYTVSADNDVVATGLMVSGTQMLDLGVLPTFDVGKAEGHTLSVHAVNTFNTPGDASVALGAVKSLYLPLVDRTFNPLAARPAAPVGAAAPATPNGNLRIGIEWVMNYHNPASNLGQTQPDAEGLYNWLGAMGWTKSFNWGNDAAWEKDWRDCTLGGIDCSLGVDRAEFAYFSGHGSPASFYFGVSRDYGGAWGGNSRFQNVRWAGFSSCQTLRAGPYVGPGNPPLTDWFNSFQGSYMLLGFHSVMGDIPFGATLGYNMFNPLYVIYPWMQPSVAQAWVNTAFAMNAGKPAYLYAVGAFNPVNFKLPSFGNGYLPPLTGIYQFNWVWWDE